MRYTKLRATCTMLALLASMIATAGFGSALAHQDAADDPLAGTTVEVLSSGQPMGMEERALMLMRVTMEPGTVIPPHQHPGPVALYVESGVFGTEFFAGTGLLTRAAAEGTPGPTQELVPGDNITMQAGDHLFYDGAGGATHTMRNDGDEPLVLLVSVIFDTTKPGFMFVEGTPEATSSNSEGHGLMVH